MLLPTRLVPVDARHSPLPRSSLGAVAVPSQPGSPRLEVRRGGDRTAQERIVGMDHPGAQPPVQPSLDVVKRRNAGQVSLLEGIVMQVVELDVGVLAAVIEGET